MTPLPKPPWPDEPHIIFDDTNAEHCARHGVAPWEIEDIILNGGYVVRPHKKRKINRKYRNRYLVDGRTIGGRALFIVIDYISPDGIRPVTAFDAR